MDWKSISYMKDEFKEYVNIGVHSNDRNLINRIHRVVKKELEKDQWEKTHEQKG